MALYCTACKTKLRGKPQICPGCGRPIIYSANPPKLKDIKSPYVICMECGESVEGNLETCPKCGNTLDSPKIQLQRQANTSFSKTMNSINKIGSIAGFMAIIFFLLWLFFYFSS